MSGDPPALLTDAERALLRPARAGFVAPMLATLTDEGFSDPARVYERKLDGVLDGTCPELVEAVAAQLAPATVLDGEVVAFDGARTRFERLQGRRGLHDHEGSRPGFDRDGRLRRPRYQGLREDEAPADVVREEAGT